MIYHEEHEETRRKIINKMKLKTKKSKLITLLIILLIVPCLGNYQPSPTPELMGDFVVYAGETFSGEFTIEDASGPEGFLITCEPNSLVISEPNITNITGGDGVVLAKEYTYRFSYNPTGNGEKIFTVTATDLLGISVTAQIRFDVKDNAPHVFTGCRRVTAASGTSDRIIGEVWKEGEQLTTWPVLYDKDYIYYLQSKIENGKAKTNKFKVAKNKSV